MKPTMKEYIAFSALIAAASAGAATIAVDAGRNAGVSVAEGTTTTLTDTVRFGENATFIKAGAGELVMPLERLDHSKDVSVNVTDGTLTLQPGTLQESAQVPACVSEKAAFWVDASDTSGSVVKDGDTVTSWCDRRETSPASPTQWNAVPRSAGKGSKQIAQTLTMKDGRTAVYFGGFDKANDNYMRFRLGSVESSISNVRAMFAVHGVYECWGSPIGATGNPCDWFAGASINTYSAAQSAGHFIQYANTMSGIFTGRTYLDATRIDPFVVPPKYGFQLLETEFTDVPTVVNAFYNMKNSAGRQGGDYLAEAIVFTNRLSAAERLEVENYLMRKWNLGLAQAQSGTLEVAVASNATVSVSVADGVSTNLASVSFTGEGAFEKSGAGCFNVGKGQFLGSRGTFDLKAGSASVCASHLPALKIAAGEKVTSVVTPASHTADDFTNKTWYAKYGHVVSKTAASSADRFEKEGSDTLIVQSIPSDIRRVDVSGGTLVLQAPSTESALIAGAPIGATIPNADFEQSCTANASFNRCLFPTAGTMLNGWTRSSKYTYVGYLCEDHSPGDTYATSPHGRKTMSYAPIPQGVQALIICNNGEAYTDQAVFPKSGRYVLSLLESSRYNDEKTCGYQVKIGATWAAATVRATRLQPAQEFRRVRIDLGYVEAGTQCFGFSLIAGNTRNYVDGALVFDDLHVDYVGETAESGVTLVPNGDFENFTNTEMSVEATDKNPVLAYMRTNANEAVGWTFSNADSVNPAVAVVTPSTPISRAADGLLYDNYRFSDIVDGLFGSAHLSFCGTAGSASTTFTLKKGHYALRLKALHRGGNYGGFSYAASGKSTIAATVTIGGNATALGSVSFKNSIMTAYDWPTNFEVTEDDASVTLTLSQTETKGMCLVDDVAVVAQTATLDYGSELVVNGSFESTATSDGLSGWTVLTSTFGDQSVQAVNPDATLAKDDVPNQFGPVPYDGLKYLYVNNDAGIYQTVSLVPGLYRLTFAAHTRNTADFDQQPIRAWLGDTSGNKVVEIGSTPLITSLFDQEHVWEFAVTTAGSYRLYLQGTDYFKEGYQHRHTSIADGISLKRIRETDAKPSVSNGTQIRLAAGTRLRLDYDGEIEVDCLYYGGKICRGTLSSATNPEFIDGRGTLTTAPAHGLILIFR